MTAIHNDGTLPHRRIFRGDIRIGENHVVAADLLRRTVRGRRDVRVRHRFVSKPPPPRRATGFAYSLFFLAPCSVTPAARAAYDASRRSTGCATRVRDPARRSPAPICMRHPGFPVATMSACVAVTCVIFALNTAFDVSGSMRL